MTDGIKGGLPVSLKMSASTPNGGLRQYLPHLPIGGIIPFCCWAGGMALDLMTDEIKGGLPNSSSPPMGINTVCRSFRQGWG